MGWVSRRGILLLVLLALAVVLPPLGGIYYARLATLMAIYGIAALSVDLLLGYAGLITFGQAALFGVGAYAAGMLTVAGITSAFIVWPLAVLITMIFALVIGGLSIRTRGFQFIMVTLAFAQMIYYFAQSLRSYGGNDGFTMPVRNSLGFIQLTDINLYYVSLALVVVVVFVCQRIVASQFGMVTLGLRDNERRTAAIGLPPYPYKLVAFVIAGGIAGLAGALMANHARFVSPEVASWQFSGELLAMVILGSSNTLIGPIVGAVFYLAFREVLSDYTTHWMLFFGPLLIIRVLLMRDGLWGVALRALGEPRAREPAPSEAGAAAAPPVDARTKTGADA
jgi:branched-chain amino acid transport system permease protein